MWFVQNVCIDSQEYDLSKSDDFKISMSLERCNNANVKVLEVKSRRRDSVSKCQPV